MLLGIIGGTFGMVGDLAMGVGDTVTLAIAGNWFYSGKVTHWFWEHRWSDFFERK